jgi:CubicO group peptidase (beta-lactamase class C family)
VTGSNPLPFGSAKDLGFCPQRTRNLVQVLQREVDSKRLPGAVSLIARRGQVLLHETVGQQDPFSSVPMGLDAIFRIYSMTKPIVSVAVMMLMERGSVVAERPGGPAPAGV